jgi:hypothetical protein
MLVAVVVVVVAVVVAVAAVVVAVVVAVAAVVVAVVVAVAVVVPSSGGGPTPHTSPVKSEKREASSWKCTGSASLNGVRARHST